MSRVARALLCEPPFQVCVGDVLIPDPGPGEVLVQIAFSAISPGTELRCLAGLQPATPNGAWIPGYSVSGTIVAVGEGCLIAPGARVYCSGTSEADVPLMWGGHCSLALKSESDVFAVADDVDLLSASYAHLAAIARRGVRISRPRAWEKVAVLGLGPIGQLSARLFAAEGSDVLALDLSHERVEIARRAGVAAEAPTCGIAEAVRQRFGRGADIVVDATGVPAVIAHAIDAAREKPWDDSPEPGPKIVIQGSYPAELAIPYQEAFMKEVTFLVPRDCQPSDVRAVLESMRSGKLVVSDLASVVVAPDDASSVYDQLRKREAGLLSAAIDWSK